MSIHYSDPDAVQMDLCSLTGSLVCENSLHLNQPGTLCPETTQSVAATTYDSPLHLTGHDSQYDHHNADGGRCIDGFYTGTETADSAACPLKLTNNPGKVSSLPSSCSAGGQLKRTVVLMAVC